MSQPLRGTVRVVPDKSITHRAVLLSALARGCSTVIDPNPGADCAATLRAVEALGVEVRREPGRWTLTATGLREPEDVLDLGNSGTGLRLLTGVLAAHPFLSVLTGDSSLRRRPMERIIGPLQAMGARIEARAGGRAPLAVRGALPRGLVFDNVTGSAQVKSALLLAGLGLREGVVEVRESRPSRDHTERMLAWLGASIRVTVESASATEGTERTADLPADKRDQTGGYVVTLRPGPPVGERTWSVPGDVSAALFPLVAAAITPGSSVTVEGVGLNPTRTGALDALARMGANLEIRPDPVAGPEPTGSITVAYGPLQAVDVRGAEIPRLIDEIPILAVAAACAEGESRFADAAELRVKESDRVRSTCDLLRALGADVEEEPDGFRVRGGRPLHGARIATHDDHRIAMAALIAGCVTDGEVTVDTLRMIETSDPGFVERLALLREAGR